MVNSPEFKLYQDVLRYRTHQCMLDILQNPTDVENVCVNKGCIDTLALMAADFNYIINED